MNIHQNYIYYFLVTPLIFLISFLFAVKVILSKAELTFHSKIKDKLVWFAIIIYSIVFSFLAILKYNAYNMGMVDLGRMDQMTWNTLHGKLFMGTFEFGNFSRIFTHFEPIFILIAPLYLIFSSPKTLLILQALVISLGAFAVFRLAKLKLGNDFAATCFSVAYLCFPSLQCANLIDFHADMLAITFLLFAFYYMVSRQWFKYGIFILLSLMCREYVSVIVIMLGFYILIKERVVKFGILTLLVGIIWAIGVFVVLPTFLPADFNVSGDKDGYLLTGIYKPLGNSIKDIIINILSHPIKIAKDYISSETIGTFVLLFLPVGFLSMLDLPSLIICLPIFAAVILSSYFSYTNHHNGIIIPFIFISAIYGANFIVDKGKYFLDRNNFIKRFLLKRNNLVFAVSVFVLSSSLLSCLFYGYSPLSIGFWRSSAYRYRANIHQFRSTEHDRTADKIIKMVPQDASVSASNHLASHLSQRETIYHFPYPKDFTSIDYVLVDLLEYAPVYWNPRDDEITTLRKLFLDKNFFLKSWQDGILLFQKRLKREEGCYVNISLIGKAMPQYPVNRTFGNRILLLGYDLNYDKFQPGNKYRVIYYWHVLVGFDEPFLYNYFGNVENLNKEYILIDTFEKDYKKLRIIHLPMYILYPPKAWKAGDIIKEEFEFYLPEDLPAGNYNWKIGFYIVPNFFFIQTENKNLVSGTQEIKLKTIKIGRDN